MESVKPEEYLKYSHIHKRNIQDIIDQFKDKLKDISGKCMDVGCGPGDSTLKLLLPTLHPDATLIGTDISEDMIKYAKQYFCESERLQFEVMDIETTYLHEKYINTFDHIFSFNTLHWCLDIKRAFRNIYRMLRLDGTALLYYRIECGLHDILEALTNDNRFASYQLKYENVFEFDKNFVVKTEGKDFLERIGFHVYAYTHKTEYCTTEWWERKLPEFIERHISPLIIDLPDSLKKEFEIQFREEAMKNSIDPNVEDTFRRNLIAGDSAVVFTKKCKKV